MEPIVRPGNSKTGKIIGKVALPSQITCPGKGECANFCYGSRLERLYKNYRKMVHRHLKILHENPFGYMEQIIRDIETNGFPVVRISENGDLFDVLQINIWRQVAQRFPDVQFYSYTRSWRIPELKRAIERLNSEPNVVIRASVENGETPPNGWLYTKVVPKGSKAPDGMVICLEDQGLKPNCISCKLCWTNEIPVAFYQS